MDVPRHSTNQRRIIAAWIGVELLAILFGLPSWRFDTGTGRAVPDTREVMCLFVIVTVASGMAALYVRGRPLILIGLATLAMLIYIGYCYGISVGG